MTYESEVQKTEQVQFVELYRVTIGNDIYRYTSCDHDVVFEGEKYTAAPIKRSTLRHELELKPYHITITAPLSDEVLSYIANTPVEPAKVEIWRAVSPDTSLYRKIFTGRIKSVTFKDKLAQISLESVTVLLKSRLPRFVYQAYCNNSLFDEVCGLNIEDYKLSTGVAVSGNNLISANFSAQPNGYYTGGHVRFGTDMRLITNHVTDTITLQIPFDARVQTGTVVDVFPGCDKSPAMCKNKFNNINRFLGFPYIPSKNIAIVGFR